MRTNICKDCENEFELKPEEKKATALLCPDCKAARLYEADVNVTVLLSTEIREATPAQLMAMDAARTAARALIDEDAVIYMKGCTWCVGVPLAKYPKTRKTDWKKWIDNDLVRWGRGTTWSAAIKSAANARSTRARARAAAEMIAAAAATKSEEA